MLQSNCCNAPDKTIRVLDMLFSEMDICPHCGMHCTFEEVEEKTETE